jgi:hypothetical protein
MDVNFFRKLIDMQSKMASIKTSTSKKRDGEYHHAHLPDIGKIFDPVKV